MVLWARTAASSSARGLAAAAKWLAVHLPPLPIGLPLRMAGSMALQLLLALVPSVPVRVKDIVVSFEVALSTICADSTWHEHAVPVFVLICELQSASCIV